MTDRAGFLLSSAHGVRGRVQGVVGRRRRLVGALAVLVVIGIPACTNVNTDVPGSDVDNAVAGFLKPHERDGIATLDFAAEIEGSWSRVVIVCHGSTRASMEKTLGFAWPDGPDPSDSSFIGMLIFANDESVDDFLSVGQNDFSQDLYFTPCSTPSDPGSSNYPNRIVLSKTSSELTFHFSRPEHLWYVSHADLESIGSHI